MDVGLVTLLLYTLYKVYTFQFHCYFSLSAYKHSAAARGKLCDTLFSDFFIGMEV